MKVKRTLLILKDEDKKRDEITFSVPNGVSENDNVRITASTLAQEKKRLKKSVFSFITVPHYNVIKSVLSSAMLNEHQVVRMENFYHISGEERTPKLIIKPSLLRFLENMVWLFFDPHGKISERKNVPKACSDIFTLFIMDFFMRLLNKQENDTMKHVYSIFQCVYDFDNPSDFTKFVQLRSGNSEPIETERLNRIMLDTNKQGKTYPISYFLRSYQDILMVYFAFTDKEYHRKEYQWLFTCFVLEMLEGIQDFSNEYFDDSPMTGLSFAIKTVSTQLRNINLDYIQSTKDTVIREHYNFLKSLKSDLTPDSDLFRIMLERSDKKKEQKAKKQKAKRKRRNEKKKEMKRESKEDQTQDPVSKSYDTKNYKIDIDPKAWKDFFF